MIKMVAVGGLVYYSIVLNIFVCLHVSVVLFFGCAMWHVGS